MKHEDSRFFKNTSVFKKGLLRKRLRNSRWFSSFSQFLTGDRNVLKSVATCWLWRFSTQTISPRWFKVTFLSPSWSLLSLWKGHVFTIPKRSRLESPGAHFFPGWQELSTGLALYGRSSKSSKEGGVLGCEFGGLTWLKKTKNNLTL